MAQDWNHRLNSSILQKLLLMLFSLGFSGIGFSAQQKAQPMRPSVFPADMNCEKLTSDKEVHPAITDSILKRGTSYYLCRPKSQALLARARTVAIVVLSVQTISCGDV